MNYSLIQGKKWGTTQQLFHLNNVEVHRINITKGGYCSLHMHHAKHNRFIVTSGLLQVSVYMDGSASVEDVTVLGPGMMTDIPPSVYHRFKALEDTDALEIYWVTIDSNDIERMDVGGISKQ